jgi:hypothetical protein
MLASVRLSAPAHHINKRSPLYDQEDQDSLGAVQSTDRSPNQISQSSGDRLDEDVRLWALHIGVYAVSKGDRLAVEGWSGLWPEDPPEDAESYGSCAVCGDAMGADSEPHTYSADEECHAGCCPACAVEVPEDLEAIVKRLNTADYGVYREPGLGDENDRDEAERDYKVGFFGHSVGLIKQPGFSYWTLCGYDDADEQQPYGSSAPEELESNEEL